jgi:aryl-phospho-beta-D-glucosidase BglC (GH1 family)
VTQKCLGSWFVLERWIADAPFRCAASPAQSDLDVACGSNAKSILEQHWNAWITEADWAWLKEHGFNAVRIPVRKLNFVGFPTDAHQICRV